MQGFNMGRYHAPSSLDSALTADQRQTKRSRTSAAAPPTIRFEMPFAIWCQTCPSHSNSRLIGQGVRFNARKTRVGAYFSTPIWSFEIKHTACGGRIEIRTDPANHDFTVTEGARRRDTGDDAAVAERTGGMLLEGGGMIKTREEEERDAARQDAFAAFEGKKEKAQESKSVAQRLEELRSVKERDWKDPDAANRRLRNNFRGIRRARDKDRERGESLAQTMGFGFELLESNDADAKRAALMEFSSIDSSLDSGGAALGASAKPLFSNKPAAAKGSKLSGSVQDLHKHLVGNTRASLNPFSQGDSDANMSESKSSLPQALRGIKRKKQTEVDVHEQVETVQITPSAERVQSMQGTSTTGLAARSDQRSAAAAAQTMTAAIPKAAGPSLVAYDSD